MTQENIQRLNLLEQQLTQLLSQKQSLQRQVLEIDNALAELDGKDEAYHIVGTVMIKKNTDELTKELTQKKEMITVRMESFVKQEQTLRDQMKSVQEQVMNELKGSSGDDNE